MQPTDPKSSSWRFWLETDPSWHVCGTTKSLMPWVTRSNPLPLLVHWKMAREEKPVGSTTSNWHFSIVDDHLGLKLVQINLPLHMLQNDI